ncbi:hypothetical protein CVT24_010170 [Panaeolus cyanescens]|uniref:Ubiquitin-like protease family profile domain-containing protein n=1 Tax=Panaeolus cyanescens TaxID=181874 RepID=A0A409YW25_9AGAR|nr:hypothetical protein CVT24_010170 [Panaeolus cyanescens]
MDDIPIDITGEDDNVFTFNLTDWIGPNKVLPPDNKIPTPLANYFAACRDIPDHILQNHYPNKQWTVQQFMQYKLPPQTHNLPTCKVAECYLDLPENADIVNHTKKALPSRALVRNLDNYFRQAVLNGKKSVYDPGYPDTRLPLWYVRYWDEMWRFHDIQKRWGEALEWLDNLEKRVNTEEGVDGWRELLHRTRHLLSRLRWSEETDIPGANRCTTDMFADFLSNGRRMSTSHMNMMFARLADRLEEDEVRDQMVVLETLRFWQEINKANSQKDLQEKKSSRFINHLEKRLRNNEIDFVVFPARMDKEEHWLTFRIDIKMKQLGYGDSMSHTGFTNPSPIVKKIQQWSKVRLGVNLKNIGDVLAHGRQEDYTDCGIAAVSTAECEVFPDLETTEQWSSTTKEKHRLRWFADLTERHISMVNCSAQVESYAVHLLSQTALAPHDKPQDSHPSVSTTDCGIPTQTLPTLDQQNLPSQLPCTKRSDFEDSTITVDSAQSKGEKERKRKRQPGSSFAPEPSNKASKSNTKEDTSVSRKFSSGLPKSTIWDRVQRSQIENGTFVIDPAKLLRFKLKILEIDSRADVQSATEVRHFLCGKILAMKTAYNTSNFNTHAQACKGSPSGGTLDIASYFKPRLPSAMPKSQSQDTNNPSQAAKCLLPCPGLDIRVYKNVAQYLDRTGAGGGGAPSVTTFAFSLYGKAYIHLSNARKDLVKLKQSEEWQWRNNHASGKVFSTSCIKVGTQKGVGAQSATAREAHPGVEACNKCLSVLQLKQFKVAAALPRPPDEMYKYVNTMYRNKQLASIYARCIGLREILEDTEVSPLIKYVHGVLNRKYTGSDLFASMIEALALKHQKEERGIGMQRMRYAPELVEFSHILFTHSPRAYEQLREVISIPDVRTLRVQRARQPRFPIGIQERTFKLAKEQLQNLQYIGPVALSCDDTKLLASLRPYYDSDRKGFFLLGAVGDPIQILDVDHFREIVRLQTIKKATKLRLFCLQVPLPKIPTVVLSAIAIPDNLTAPELLEFTWKILEGLFEHEIQVVSYAADGSTVERSVQDLLIRKASNTATYTIKHPADDGTCHENLSFPVFYFDRHPIAVLQDPKHLLKTCRNNIFSGAQVPVLPNHVILYSDVRKMGMEDSPIYVRDVEKVDRQDDNAATRLFSGAVLEWLTEKHPEMRGLIIFLFICGEMIDAYQNRSITLHERCVMILRAHFFFELWERFIEVSGYSKTKHFVSPQCITIVKTLIHGFLQLIYIYRGFKTRYPLLPWLMVTEAPEHVFGMCRQIVKDFTMLDFQFMVPKLFIKLREAFFSARNLDGKATASGYLHSLTNIQDLNLAALSNYPTDSEIQDLTEQAYGEAHSLFVFLGVTADELYGRQARLPSISSWYSGGDGKEGSAVDDDDTTDSDDGSDLEVDEDVDYQVALDDLEGAELGTDREERRMMDYRFANVALTIDEQTKICDLPEFDTDGIVEAYAEYATHIQTILSDIASTHGNELADALPPLNLMQPSSTVNPHSLSVDLSELVKLRFAHQTHQALTGVRKVGNESAISRTTRTPQLTERQRIIREMAAIVKESGDRGVGSGLERAARWQASAPAPSTGNAANAATVAKASAKNRLNKRKEVYESFGLPSMTWDAHIGGMMPLQAVAGVTGSSMGGPPSGYGFAVTSHNGLGVILCKVLSVYSKGGGKGAKHSYVDNVNMITAASNIVIQIYQHHYGTRFNDKPQSGSSLFPHLDCFDIIPSSMFICSLLHSPKATPGGLLVSTEDSNTYQILRKLLPQISLALKTLNKRKSRKSGATATAVEEDGDTD